MGKESKKITDLTTGQPREVLWRFCIPLFASVIFQQFYNIADSFVAGKFIGEYALEAGIKLHNMVIAAFTTLGNGISNFTAQNIGANQLERIREGRKAGIQMVWTLCVPIVLLYTLGAKPLISLFIDNPTEFAFATTLDLILRVVLVKILAVPLGYIGIWMSWPLGCILGTSLSLMYYKKIWHDRKDVA